MTTFLAPNITASAPDRPLERRLLLHTPRGLTYADERHEDRTVEGVLLGEADAETASQRTAMEQLLCRVCSGPPERTGDGVLWLLPLPTGTPDDWPWDGWPEGITTTDPPVCLRHARLSPSRSEVDCRAFFAAEAEVIGVYGTLHPAPGVLANPVERALRFDDPRMPWMVATLFVRQLRRLTPADEQGSTR
ncbi:hypothetical protein [Streptomyces exfoliatus]|uniref:hypothetical protein n=1 Tax=Streptomyces exfoliatus TaxID=1905 RepID=UPI0004664920|nr:hypothetical protein [Streptomyces exfoliatus]